MLRMRRTLPACTCQKVRLWNLSLAGVVSHPYLILRSERPPGRREASRLAARKLCRLQERGWPAAGPRVLLSVPPALSEPVFTPKSACSKSSPWSPRVSKDPLGYAAGTALSSHQDQPLASQTGTRTRMQMGVRKWPVGWLLSPEQRS